MQHKIIDQQTASDPSSNTQTANADNQPQQTQDIDAILHLVPRDLYFYLFSFIQENNLQTLRRLGSVNKILNLYVKQYSAVADAIYYAVGHQFTVINGDRCDNKLSKAIMDAIGSQFNPTYASLKSSINNQYTLYFFNFNEATLFCDQTANTTYVKDHDVEYIDSISGVVPVRLNYRDVFSLKHVIALDNNMKRYSAFKTKPTNVSCASFAFFRHKQYNEVTVLDNDESKKCILS